MPNSPTGGLPGINHGVCAPASPFGQNLYFRFITCFSALCPWNVNSQNKRKKLRCFKKIRKKENRILNLTIICTWIVQVVASWPSTWTLTSNPLKVHYFTTWVIFFYFNKLKYQLFSTERQKSIEQYSYDQWTGQFSYFTLLFRTMTVVHAQLDQCF